MLTWVREIPGGEYKSDGILFHIAANDICILKTDQKKDMG
jgi:hypothetical protein